jgi:hypothetical protein
MIRARLRSVIRRSVGFPLVIGLALTACGGGAETDSTEEPAQTTEQIWSDYWADTGFSSAGSRVGAAPWAGNHLTLFWRNSQNHILHSWQPEGTGWQAVEDIGSGAGSSPSASSTGNQRIDIVWRRSSDSHLIHRVYDNGFWPTEDVGTVVAGSPVVATWGSWFYSVFWRGTNKRLYHQWYDLTTSSWSGVEDFGGTLESDPAVIFNDGAQAGAKFDIFYRGANGRLKHKIMSDVTGWVPGPEEEVGGSIRSGTTPTAAVRWPGVAIETFWVGTDSKLRRRPYHVNTGWGTTETVDPNLTISGSPQAMSWGAGRVDVFAKSGSQVMQRTWTRTMEVAQIAQTQSNWCWATTGQMISRYWNREKTQCEQATQALNDGTNCCANPSACNFGGLANYPWMGLQVQDSMATGLPITIEQARTEVVARRPWDHGILWTDANGNVTGAHGVVGIDAFWFDNQWWVVINDPSGGVSYVQSYAAYLSVPGVSRGDWDFYNIRP